MLSLFKNHKKIEIKNPMIGHYKNLEDVNDQVFSHKMAGDGFAVNPTEGKVHAPFDGEVVVLPDTHHAIGLKTEEGLELLIHVGINTVSLKGEGFVSHVKIGEQVEEGDLLLEFNLGEIKEKVDSMDTPIIIANGEDFEIIEMNENAKFLETAMVAKKR